MSSRPSRMPAKMRHLHFTQSLEPLQGGGLGTSTAALHRGLLAAGVESRLCSTFREAPERPAECTMEFRRVGPDFLYFAPQLSRGAEQLVAEADVVHGHGLYVGTNYAFGRAARRQRKSLVYHVHGMFEPYVLGRSRWKKRLVHWLFEDANFRSVRLWRALTQKEADQIKALGIRAPVAVIPNGLNLEDFPKPAHPAAAIRTPLVPTLQKTRCRALFHGRLHPKKGLDLLVGAWSRLTHHWKNWELVIAGPDEGGYLAEVRVLASAAGTESQLVFTGPVTGVARSALLHSADLFILPSYSEGFSMSLLEAMGCEVPVVATHACNFPEISLSQAGWECEASLTSLAATLDSALSADARERQERGRNGRALVARSYTWPAVVARVLDACAAYC